ncbi:MAG TPA: aminoacyl-tRNA hydrolase [Geminicoccaceae bacterium]|nr:aminoacyl-tRNA hydrolase [Geminicoccaceae bacterium]
MLLFAGLGNPGPKYARHRHNIGFMAADAIHARHGFPPWRNRFRGLASEGTLGGERVLLLKPQTYMNESGRAVAEAARFFKLAPSEVVAFHDELDLAPGKVRVKTGGGVAGHNGLRSIDACLGTREFVRVRLGIGHPGHKERVLGHVLGDFSGADRDEWLEALLDAVADAAPLLAQGDAGKFMNRVAVLTRPADEEPEPAAPRTGPP